MRKFTTSVAMVAGAVMAMSAMTAASAVPQDGDAAGGPDKVTAEVRQQASTAAANERLRVVVSLDDGARIATTQDRVIRKLPAQARANVTYRFGSQHAFSAMLTPAEIRAAAALSDVVAVSAQPEVQRFDAEAHPLTATDVAHAAGHTGQGTVVAVIDDALEWDHDAFGGHATFPNDKVIDGYDFADYDDDIAPDCTKSKGKPGTPGYKPAQSHGTAVTGVAAGDGGGVVGTARDAQVVFLKISGSNCAFNGDIIGALDWVATNAESLSIDVVNMSFGSIAPYHGVCDDDLDPAYDAVLDAVDAAGVTLVAAAGNSAWLDATSSPACHSQVVAVGAAYDANIGGVAFQVCSDETTDADKVTCYSNGADWIDVFAPAHCAFSAGLNGGSTDCFGGTSSASPYTAGIAALIKAQDGTRTPDQVRDLLVAGGDTITDHRTDAQFPRVNSAGSLGLDG